MGSMTRKRDDGGEMLTEIRRAVARIPKGKVATYGEVARAAGFPGAARQVARALYDSGGKLPWHRVLGAGGGIRLPRVEGLEQRLLLTLEGVEFRGGRVRMDRHEFRFPSGQAPVEDARLGRVTKICLAHSKTTRELRGGHATFRTGTKVFAYFLNNHHGDGIVSIACKALPGDNTFLAAANPERFYLPAYIGPRGWVALRLDVGETDWEEVAELVEGSYGLTARCGARGQNAAKTRHPGHPAPARSYGVTAKQYK